MLMTVLLFLLSVLLVIWAVGRFYLVGPDLSRWDKSDDADASQSFPLENGPSQGHAQKVAEVQQFGAELDGLSQGDRLRLMRSYMDEMGAERTFDGEVREVDVDGIPAEWVLVPDSDASRRVLYIHGGAFVAGSPLSHRAITQQYAVMCKASVLAIDYRLMPEHKRIDGVEDCRTAYRWILENGPDGPGAVEHLVVSGDSAGGNLSLHISNWARDQGLRQPDAVVAFSPLVDGTHSGSSITENLESDVMLGPLFAIMLKIPLSIRRWINYLQTRMHPSDPVISPIFADLSGLPPTLVQVSEAEMLLDDARRYVNKARASGTRAVVQSWPDLLHVWQIFYPEADEAVQAMEEVRKFIETTVPES